jgi:hypothetical protein
MPLVPLVVQHHRQKTPNLPFKMWPWWTVFFPIERPFIDTIHFGGYSSSYPTN